MNRIIRCTQGGDLWQAARVGRITGSRVDDLLAPPTTRASTRKGIAMEAGSEALVLVKYRQDLIVERLYRRAVNHAVTSYMQDGSEREPFARMLYEVEEQTTVELVGFALHPLWDWFGSSADGLVGEDGGVELKSPTESVHDAYAENPEILMKEYKGQVLGNMVCFPKRAWWDLASFQPYAPDNLKLVKAPRFHRSDWAETIATIEDKAQALNAQVEAEIARRGFPPTEWTIMPNETKAKPVDDPDDPYAFLDDNLAGVP